MFTDDFSIFKQMVSLVQNQNIEYKILYSHTTRSATNDYTECCSVLLVSNLFTLLYKRDHAPSDIFVLKSFVTQNNGIDVDFDINCDNGIIKLDTF